MRFSMRIGSGRRAHYEDVEFDKAGAAELKESDAFTIWAQTVDEIAKVDARATQLRDLWGFKSVTEVGNTTPKQGRQVSRRTSIKDEDIDAVLAQS